MSDSDSDAQISVRMTQDPAEKPAKKPRKKMEVTDRKRAASSANLAKAREARLKKKQEKLAAESETQTILNEIVAEQKAKKAKAKRPDNVEETPVFGKPEKPAKKQYVELSESEESESEASEESEESSSEDSDVEFVLKPANKKRAPRNEHARSQERSGDAVPHRSPKKSAITEEMEALKAEVAALRKKEKKSKPAPVNVYFNQKGSGEKKASALDATVKWD